jgi:hypothetical protein
VLENHCHFCEIHFPLEINIVADHSHFHFDFALENRVHLVMRINIVLETRLHLNVYGGLPTITPRC